MFKLNNDLLVEIGLGALSTDEKNKMLSHIYETLEMRVGVRLANQMSDEQLDEFEAFINKNDEEGALKWLETNFPNYKDVVADELEKLKSEIKQVAPQILANSATNEPTASSVPPVSPTIPSSIPVNPPIPPPYIPTPPSTPTSSAPGSVV